ncbi:hypothetical protein [Sandaracinus amylolyticus]|uniref:Uncharacterized protein n=1 Tax=Sandaracinus amylolyticus TaxID=927083 RepID=A0A0F6SE06_9BACT|nr:hypothetical protein [Sandaracinus amylolyticus]AKF04359.1 hypothetical protein DB32_001508 [Sandaracinus amylolyticus]
MPTVGDLLRYVLPVGTVPGSASTSLASCPVWPPDAFAAAATLVERSACYTRDRYSGRGLPRGSGARWSPYFGLEYLARTDAAGARWRSEMRVPDEAQKAWETIVAGETDPIGPETSDAVADAAIELLAIADEACEGIGFAPEHPSPITSFVLEEHLRFVSRTAAASVGAIPDVRVSLCIAVPHDRACVQPKSRAAQVGCAMRALSHHVALLPAKHEIETRWMVGDLDRAQGPFNLLCVPFPYRMRGDAIEAGPLVQGASGAGHFRVKQTWLPEKDKDRVAFVADLVRELVRVSEREVGQVHGVVLPELALDSPTVRGVAKELAKLPSLELFIAGTSAIYPKSGAPRNLVFASLLEGGEVRTHWWQSKHHRWRLDEGQIRRYHLGHTLDPARRWWEDIDVDDRQLSLYVFRPDASIAVLVCEDLARIDPVQPVLRAMGPSLVIAVLMDGPQLDRRWPGRYAGALADDPGSSVLTLTSLGMMERSVMPGETEPRQVALWKDASGQARELSLPRGAHGLVLSLDASREERWTLDGRTDRGRTVRLSLGAVRAVAHPSPPAWLSA